MLLLYQLIGRGAGNVQLCRHFIHGHGHAENIRGRTLSPELAAEMKKLAKDKKQRAKADMAYANSTYRMEMEQDALKVEALKLLK